jgi:hypothetical protein
MEEQFNCFCKVQYFKFIKMGCLSTPLSTKPFLALSKDRFTFSQVTNKLKVILKDYLFMILRDLLDIWSSNSGLILMPLKMRRDYRKFCSVRLIHRWKYSTIWFLKKSQADQSQFQRGVCIPFAGAQADHMTTAWLAKFCNGLDMYKSLFFRADWC